LIKTNIAIVVFSIFRFYWSSSSCVYGALKDNAMMGNCSYQEIAQVLQMYENQLYMISPNNVNASVCFGMDGFFCVFFFFVHIIVFSSPI